MSAHLWSDQTNHVLRFDDLDESGLRHQVSLWLREENALDLLDSPDDDSVPTPLFDFAYLDPDEIHVSEEQPDLEGKTLIAVTKQDIVLE